jgi:hypothetical protein
VCSLSRGICPWFKSHANPFACRESQNLIGIELGDTKEIGSLVNASTYSAVDAEICILLVSLLLSRFRVKQAQIELSRDDDRHRVVKDRIYHEYPTSVELSLIALIAGIFESSMQRTIQNLSSRTPYPSPCLHDLEQPHAASPRPCPLHRRPTAGSAPFPGPSSHPQSAPLPETSHALVMRGP